MKISEEFRKTRDTQQKWSEMKITDKRRKGFTRERARDILPESLMWLLNFEKNWDAKSKEEQLKRAKRKKEGEIEKGKGEERHKARSQIWNE